MVQLKSLCRHSMCSQWIISKAFKSFIGIYWFCVKWVLSWRFVRTHNVFQAHSPRYLFLSPFPLLLPLSPPTFTFKDTVSLWVWESERCICACAGVHASDMPLEARGWHRVDFCIILHLIALRLGVPLNWTLAALARQAVQQAPERLQSLSPQHWHYRDEESCPVGVRAWALEIQIQVFMVVY